MNRVQKFATITSVLIIVFLLQNTFIAIASVISQDDGEGPVVILPFEEGTEVLLAIYQDFQNSFTYNPSVEIRDPDGIAIVLFLFRPLGNDSWHTIVAQIESGNTTVGIYRGPFTWYETGVEFKVTATDTLGYTTTSGSIFYRLDPFAIHPGIIFIASIPVMIVLYLWLRRRK